MRVLIVSPIFPPQNGSGSLRVHSYARSWSDEGDDMTVLTTAKPPDHRELELPNEGFRVKELSYRIPPVLSALRREHKTQTADGRMIGRWSGLRSVVRGLGRLRDRTGIFGGVRNRVHQDAEQNQSIDAAQSVHA